GTLIVSSAGNSAARESACSCIQAASRGPFSQRCPSTFASCTTVGQVSSVMSPPGGSVLRSNGVSCWTCRARQAISSGAPTATSTIDRASSVISPKTVLMTEGVLSFGQKRVGIGRKFVWAPVGLVAVEGGGPRNTLWSFKPSVTPHALSAAQAPTEGDGWLVS